MDGALPRSKADVQRLSQRTDGIEDLANCISPTLPFDLRMAGIDQRLQRDKIPLVRLRSDKSGVIGPRFLRLIIAAGSKGHRHGGQGASFQRIDPRHLRT